MKKLKRRFRLFFNQQERLLAKPEIIQGAKNKVAMITMLSDRIDSDMILNCPMLKVIANYAVGYDNIDREAAKKHGVIVTNTPGVLTETTADLAWALIMAISRRIIEGDRLIRTGEWTGWAPTQLLGNDVFGKTLGIIGMGRIGQAVAHRACGFGMKVIYHSRHPLKPGTQKAIGAVRRSLDDLLIESDFVSLHVPLSTETYHLIGTDALAKMKRTAYLINTARGAVVDEAALVKTLHKKKIAGAGLDVFEAEPRVHKGLARLKNVVLLPHLGSASIETRTKMGEMVIENICAVLQGRQAPNQVN